eukprot:scaffold5048_cov338-Prasinococcus_capsulatus_cf.AAC.15
MVEDLNIGLEADEEPDAAKSVKYSYFTAGSGGVGTTILVRSPPTITPLTAATARLHELRRQHPLAAPSLQLQF